MAGKARDIERFAGMEPFLREIDRRGYRAIENSGQIVIFCNRAPLNWLTGPDPISSKEIGQISFQDFGTSAEPPAQAQAALFGRRG